MRAFRRIAGSTLAGLGLVAVAAGPAGAHGVGARADLPLPAWQFAYAAAFALLASFVALGAWWPEPRLARWAAGHRLPDRATRVGRAGELVIALVVGVIAAATLLAALVGPDDVASNLAPTSVYVAFWVGGQVLAASVGDVWRTANPLGRVARLVGRARGHRPDRNTATGWWSTHWPAAVGLSGFLWLELAYHDSTSLAAIAAFLLAYTGYVLVAAAAFGPGWVRVGDGFAVLFQLLAALAPVGRDHDGAWCVRPPGSGLSSVVTRPGTVAVVLVLLGGTTYDGLQRTGWWSDVVGPRQGWSATAAHTAGLVVTVAFVAAVYRLAAHGSARITGEARDDDALRRWVPSLIPIVLGYSIAHYFSLLVFEGQRFVALASDPFGRGWDLFGTAGHAIDYRLVSPGQIAWVQVAAIVVGHVVGVIAAHDLAVTRYRPGLAARSQYPLLAAMVIYTVGGLLLLLNA